MSAGPLVSAVVQKRRKREEVGQTGLEKQRIEESEEEAAGRHRKTGHGEVHAASSDSHARYGPRCRSGKR